MTVTELKRMTGYPQGRPGYVVDHIVPLARGGADKPSIMQWQTILEAKEKSLWELVERIQCYGRIKWPVSFVEIAFI